MALAGEKSPRGWNVCETSFLFVILWYMLHDMYVLIVFVEEGQCKK